MLPSSPPCLHNYEASTLRFIAPGNGKSWPQYRLGTSGPEKTYSLLSQFEPVTTLVPKDVFILCTYISKASLPWVKNWVTEGK